MNRRHVLAAPAALLAAAPAIARAAGAAGTVPAAALEAATAGPLAAFRALPGEKSYLVVAGDPASGWRAAHRPAEPMFVGSAVKTFILATWLRAVEKGALSEDTMMAIDDSVRSLVSPVFIELSGRTAARNVLEAMIAHSDNTATDVALKAVGPDNVRRFIADAGLKHTLIPDSTRRLFSWLAGAAPGEDLGWEGMVRLAKQDKLPNARPAINDTQTMMSTSEELVDYYRRALQGEFFTKPESLTEFRRIQGMADAIANVMPPNIPTYAKGGSIDWNGFLAVSLPGQAWVGGVPVGFSFTLNWNQKDGDMDAMMPKLRAAVNGVMAGIVTALA